MWRSKGPSISAKLTLVLVGMAVVAALMTGAFHGAVDIAASKASVGRTVSRLAAGLAAASSGPLAREDVDGVRRVLDSLTEDPVVRHIWIHDENGRLLASCQSPLASPSTGWEWAHRLSGGFVEASMPVEWKGRQVGTVLVRGRSDELEARLVATAETTAAALLGSFGVAVLVGWGLRRAVSEPILKLVETAEHVSAEADYSTRVERRRGDELGALYSGFNAMLEQIEMRDAALARSNRELQDFAYVASHDLQEPLRKIMTFSDRVRQTAGDGMSEQCIHYLDRMQVSAQRMQQLIQDLLEYSRVTTRGRAFTTVPLEALMGDVVNMLEVRLEEEGARIEVGALPSIDADPMQMRQLFQNLLGNALKYHKPNTPPVITVSARIIRRAGSVGRVVIGDELCELTFTDNGIGFDMRYAEKIFNVFQRLHGRAEYEGTGVGLAICRKIVERHGGTIRALSQPGEGATFVVELPVRQKREREVHGSTH